MKTQIMCVPIHRGKVIDGTSFSHTFLSDAPSHEQIGSVVQTAINNARRMGWHLADPETWIRLEFRQFTE